MTLYKHGVGFFQRRGTAVGREVHLSFRVDDMNDILKSLTVIDQGVGQVLGIDYATPQSKTEQLAGCSVQLRDAHSLRDLLSGLRGRAITLELQDATQVAGILIGSDEVAEPEEISHTLVSLVAEDTAAVRIYPLEQIKAVLIRDQQAEEDLRFFLSTALSQEDYRQITIRLTPDEHDLLVSYIAPAPTWRVSYRLIAEATDDKRKNGNALVMGWGIFDNQLEEELRDISLSLVAGMPISFTYDLYTPFTPERPHIEEEERVAAAPVHFGGAVMDAMEMMDEKEDVRAMMPMSAAAPMPKRRAKMGKAAIDTSAARESVQTNATGESLGELFQYNIATPVTVGRGQSAMVPIVTADLPYEKAYIYNGRKLPNHPVATLRMRNQTGLTLERGPVTVIENNEYVGEAVLPFTVTDAEMIVPYAVELGVKISEQPYNFREEHRLLLDNGYMKTESWQIVQRDYVINNTTNRPLEILIEHPRHRDHYTRFDTPEPAETTDEFERYLVTVPAGKELTLRVQARKLHTSRERLSGLNHRNIKQYLDKHSLLDKNTQARLKQLLDILAPIGKYDQMVKEIHQERQSIFKAQKQIQGNINALNGKNESENRLRQRYVTQLNDQENRLAQLNQEEKKLKTQIETQRNQATQLIATW